MGAEDRRHVILVGLEVVDARDAIEHVEAELRMIAQSTADHGQIGRVHDDVRIDRVGLLVLDPGAALSVENGDKVSLGGSRR